MNERSKNQTTETMEIKNYNICPTCGREVHTVLDDHGMYRVGCPYCGLRNGVSTFVEDQPTSDDREIMRKAWNNRVLNGHLNEEVRELLCLKEGGFAIVTNQDGCIVHTADNMKDVIQCLELVGDDRNYGIYLHTDGTFQYLGCTYLAWLIQEALNG